MRPRYWISLAFAAALVAAGAWSFYDNVMNPHDDSAGAVVSVVTTAAVTTTVGAAPATEEDVYASVPAGVLPPSLVGESLSASIDGEAARIQVEQLHGKGLGPGIVDAWVGEYGGGGSGMPSATIWVSRSPDAVAARELYDRMTVRISEGGSPFTGLRPIDEAGVEGYALDGMGQTHYYFVVGDDVYWLAADPTTAEDALRELLSHVMETAADE